MPLPPQFDAAALSSLIPPFKVIPHLIPSFLVHSLQDVDGLHPHSFGLLAASTAVKESYADDSFFIPATPLSIVELLDSYGVKLDGASVAVIGRSRTVGSNQFSLFLSPEQGLPLAILLAKRNATVRIVHSKTSNQEGAIRNADIIISATGKPQMIKGSWIKQGAVVVDVGAHKILTPQGERFLGDVDFNPALQVPSLSLFPSFSFRVGRRFPPFQVASKITPVPGGVGPLTVAMLLRNTLHSAQARSKRPTALNGDSAGSKVFALPPALTVEGVETPAISFQEAIDRLYRPYNY